MHTVTVVERKARLARRHRLGTGLRAAGPVRRRRGPARGGVRGGPGSPGRRQGGVLGTAARGAATVRAELVRQWLWTFGPGTERDLRWWPGSTAAAVRQALRDVSAVQVDLDGATGFLLPDDVHEVAPVQPWAALLPGLDPTVMGWADRLTGWLEGVRVTQRFASPLQQRTHSRDDAART